MAENKFPQLFTMGQESQGWLNTALNNSYNYTPMWNQQLGYNKQQADLDWQYNRQNISNPYGSISYTRNPDGSFTQNTQLSKQQQGIFNAENQAAQNRGQALNSLLGQIGKGKTPNLDYSKLPGLDYGSKLQEQTTKNAFRSASDLINQDYNKQATQEDAQLAARGIPVASELYNKVYGERNQAKNQALNQAATDSIMLGQQAADMAFNQSLGARAQRQAEQDSMYAANQWSYLSPLQQANILSGISPMSGQVNMPNAGNLSSIQTGGTQVMDNIYKLTQLAQSGQISAAEMEQGYADLANKIALAQIQAGATVDAAKAHAQSVIGAAKIAATTDLTINETNHNVNAGLPA